MNIRTTLQASVSRFAHLAGFGKVKAKSTKAEDDEDKKKNDDESAEDDSDDEKMEDDDRDESAEGNDDDAGEDDGDEDKKKKNKKAKKAASDDEDERCEDDDDDKKEARVRGVREGRRIERERIARIMSSPHAAKNIELAVSLACETGLSSKAILATLQKTASTVRSSNRSANNPRIEAGGGESAPKGAQIAKSWDQAFTKVGITPRAA